MININDVEIFFSDLKGNLKADVELCPWDIELFVEKEFGLSGLGEMYKNNIWDAWEISDKIKNSRSGRKRAYNIVFPSFIPWGNKIKTIVGIYILFGRSKNCGHIEEVSNFFIKIMDSADPEFITKDKFLSVVTLIKNKNNWTASSEVKFLRASNTLLKILNGRFIGLNSGNKDRVVGLDDRYRLNKLLATCKVKVPSQRRDNLALSVKDKLARLTELMPDLLEVSNLLTICERSKYLFNDRDKVLLSVTKLQLLTGARISEVISLPKNCILYDGDSVSLKMYPEKDINGGWKYLGHDDDEYSNAILTVVDDLHSQLDSVYKRVSYVRKCIDRFLEVIPKEKFSTWRIDRYSEFSLSCRRPKVLSESIDDFSLGIESHVFVREYEIISHLFLSEELSLDDWNSMGFKERNIYKNLIKYRATLFHKKGSKSSRSSPKECWVSLSEINYLIKSDFLKLESELRSSESFQQVLDDSLYVVPSGFNKENRTLLKWNFEVVKDYNVRGLWTGDNRKSDLFEEYNLYEFSDVKVGHSLRRLLTTDLLIAGLDGRQIAKYMGRSTPSQNIEYLYAEQAIEELSDRVSSNFEPYGEGISIQESILAIDDIEFFDESEAAASIYFKYLRTSYGGCQHDFSVSPCEHHLKCFNGCGKFLLNVSSENQVKVLKAELDGVVRTVDKLESVKSISSDIELIKVIDENLAVEVEKQSNIEYCLELHKSEEQGRFVRPFPRK